MTRGSVTNWMKKGRGGNKRLDAMGVSKREDLGGDMNAYLESHVGRRGYTKDECV